MEGLQAAELLEEVKCSSDARETIDKAFLALSKALRKIPARPVTAAEAASLVSALNFTAEVT